MAEMERITIRLSARDVATLDRLRGSADRSTFLRTLLRRATRKPKTSNPPTYEDALRALAEHAEHDPAAAVRLAELTAQDEQLERANALARG